MQTFKRILLSSLSLLLIFAFISSLIIITWQKSECEAYMDAKERDEKAGSIDFMIVGASRALSGFNSDVVNEELNCNCYNMGSPMCTLYGAGYLLAEEIDRNPINTVVLEISNHTLFRNQTKESAEGDFKILARLNSPLSKINYLIKYVPFDDWLNIYCQDIISASSWAKNAFLNTQDQETYVKGVCWNLETYNLTRPDDIIVSSFNETDSRRELQKDNVEQFIRLVDLCSVNGIDLIVVVTPMTDSYLWELGYLDDTMSSAKDFCKENGITYIDFNLLKDRDQYWNDEGSFHDDLHLSAAGAVSFSKAFSEVYKEYKSGEDISPMFFGTYAEAKQYSPYMEYYNLHSEE